MSLTGNYEAAFELTEQVVKETFEAAWDAGQIPHELPVSTAVQGVDVEGVVSILQTNAAGDLGVSFDTPVQNGLAMTLPLDVEVTEKDVSTSAAPSINPIAFHAALEITAPVAALPDAAGNKELVLNLAGLPPQQVVVRMPAAPVLPVTEELLEDGLHKAYDDELIAHTTTFGEYQVDIVDDDAHPARQIGFTIDQPPAIGQDGRGTLTLPMLVHYGNGLELTVQIGNIALIQTTTQLTIRFAGVTPGDVEIIPPLSVNSAATKVAVAAQMAVTPDYPAFWPSNEWIAGVIRDDAMQRLDSWGGDGNGRIQIFTPNSVGNAPIEIVDFDVSVQPGFLAVLFNPMAGANPSAAKNFIPTGKKFAQMLDASVVLQLADDAIRTGILEENGCGGWPCKLKDKIKGHWVKMDKPSVSLHDGYMKIAGSSEVEVDCWFDPNPSYEAKVDFSFGQDASGRKTIEPRIFDEDVDLSCLDWFLGLIIPIYGWICLGIVKSVVDRVGGEVVVEEGDRIASGTTYLAGEIHGVGSVDTELDRIDVKTAGLILSGGYIAIDTSQLSQALTASDSGSPYAGSAVSPISLHALYTRPQATHRWAFGDGDTAEGRDVQHAYVEDGVYVARLATELALPRARTTHHFARVTVANVQPEVDAGPDLTVDEGDAISFVGRFTDVEWLDTHKALWGWGDGSCGPGTVSERNDPPEAEGVVSATHAYCDNGVYTVKLWVIDDDGGVGSDTRVVTVKNVPPSVDAGDLVFAYACVPLNLVARFTDPGWCDTHVAVWEFGDCSPPLDAIVREVNDPPIGYGIAAATHTYRTCGRFLASCTVTDDDGGVGRDTVVVQVTGVKNADFEGGFCNRSLGEVANDWEPYALLSQPEHTVATASTGGIGTGLFRAEEFVVHDGQRSQRLTGAGRFRSGIYQRVGANERWDYQVSVWYHLDENQGGTCRLGLDPAGGTDPASPDIRWVDGTARRAWELLTTRVTATGRAITIFLEAKADNARVNAYFDGVMFDPSPCPLPAPEPPALPEPAPRRRCVDWRHEPASRDVGPVHTTEGFTFQSLAKQSMQIVLWGEPPDQGKLRLPPRGLMVALPFAATRVVARVAALDGRPIRMTAMDAAGARVGATGSAEDTQEVQTLEIAAAAIVTVQFLTTGREALLIELCVFRDATALVGVDDDRDVAGAGRFRATS